MVGPPGRRAAAPARPGHRRGAGRGSARRWRMPVSSDTDCPRRLPRWRRRGRPQHGLPRAGRPHPAGRRGPVVPVGGHARHRPGAAGLRLRPGARRPDRGRRAHARARGPHRRAAVPAARADRTPRLRHGVHARAARGQARGARRRRSVRAPRGHAGRGDDDRRSVLHAVPARHALDPRRHGGRGRHAVRQRSCTPATSRSTRRRSTAGPPTSTASPRRRAGCGVHLLLSDSTNAEEAGYTSSERSVGPVLHRIIEKAPHIVVVACFSSHIHRIQQVVDAARANERVVAFLGRSMLKSVEAARRLGLLHVPDEDIVGIEEVDRLDPSRVVVICTGSQGEPYSALSLMAAREHKWVKLGPDDTVVLSSSSDPGERAGDPPRGRRAVSNGRRRLPRAGRRGARERPRRPGGAPAHAVAGPAALVHPDPRRAPAPAASRAPRRRGRHPERPRDHRARTATSWRSASGSRSSIGSRPG